MGDKTHISWTQGADGSAGSTWNPIRSATGKGWHCVKCSAGCDNCYAEALNLFRGSQLPYEKGADELMLDMDMMLKPLQWQRPRKIFPCSMTDWMLADVPNSWILAMLGVTMLAGRHTFQFLTKRADRQERFLADLYAQPWDEVMDACLGALYQLVPAAKRYTAITHHRLASRKNAAMANVWIGVSCESGHTLWRAEKLASTPAAVRWLSIEPMLGGYVDYKPLLRTGLIPTQSFHWVVFGGESGKDARPFHMDAALAMIQDFRKAGVAVWVKQLGARPINSKDHVMLVTGKGDDPAEWPEEMRVQEFPQELANV